MTSNKPSTSKQLRSVTRRKIDIRRPQSPLEVPEILAYIFKLACHVKEGDLVEFSQLDFENFRNCRLVCKRWNNAMIGLLSAKHLNVSFKIFVDDRTGRQLSAVNTHLRKLTSRRSAWKSDQYILHLQVLPSIFSPGHNVLSRAFMDILSQINLNLTSIKCVLPLHGEASEYFYKEFGDFPSLLRFSLDVDASDMTGNKTGTRCSFSGVVEWIFLKSPQLEEMTVEVQSEKGMLLLDLSATPFHYTIGYGDHFHISDIKTRRLKFLQIPVPYAHRLLWETPQNGEKHAFSTLKILKLQALNRDLSICPIVRYVDGSGEMEMDYKLFSTIDALQELHLMHTYKSIRKVDNWAGSRFAGNIYPEWLVELTYDRIETLETLVLFNDSWCLCPTDAERLDDEFDEHTKRFDHYFPSLKRLVWFDKDDINPFLNLEECGSQTVEHLSIGHYTENLSPIYVDRFEEPFQNLRLLDIAFKFPNVKWRAFLCAMCVNLQQLEVFNIGLMKNYVKKTYPLCLDLLVLPAIARNQDARTVKTTHCDRRCSFKPKKSSVDKDFHCAGGGMRGLPCLKSLSISVFPSPIDEQTLSQNEPLARANCSAVKALMQMPSLEELTLSERIEVPESICQEWLEDKGTPIYRKMYEHASDLRWNTP